VTCRALGAALALIALGRVAELEAFYRAALAAGADPANLAEGALAAPLFAGFPRAIEGLAALERALPPGAAKRPVLDERPAAQRLADGETLFATIYGRSAAAVRRRLAELAPDLEVAVIEDAYGRILSRPALPPLLRELAAVAALAACGLERQLDSHVRGALACGADRAAIEEMAALGVAIEPGGERSTRAALGRAFDAARDAASAPSAP
jgi:alkylhydroperoxidase/carboxymuconolactone decarboxylase family protein YurZ